MQVKINGKIQSCENNILLSEILKLNKVQNPEMVSVQINGEFVENINFDKTKINDNDEIDFMYFMGGGF